MFSTEGVMLMQLWMQEYPFEQACATPVELLGELQEIDISCYLRPPAYPRNLAHFIQSMLHRNAYERSTAQVKSFYDRNDIVYLW